MPPRPPPPMPRAVDAAGRRRCRTPPPNVADAAADAAAPPPPPPSTADAADAAAYAVDAAADAAAYAGAREQANIQMCQIVRTHLRYGDVALWFIGYIGSARLTYQRKETTNDQTRAGDDSRACCASTCWKRACVRPLPISTPGARRVANNCACAALKRPTPGCISLDHEPFPADLIDLLLPSIRERQGSIASVGALDYPTRGHARSPTRPPLATVRGGVMTNRWVISRGRR